MAARVEESLLRPDAHQRPSPPRRPDTHTRSRSGLFPVGSVQSEWPANALGLRSNWFAGNARTPSACSNCARLWGPVAGRFQAAQSSSPPGGWPSPRAEKRLATWTQLTTTGAFFGDPCHRHRPSCPEARSESGFLDQPRCPDRRCRGGAPVKNLAHSASC